jgi:integrase
MERSTAAKRRRSTTRGQILTRGAGRWMVRVPRGDGAKGKREYHNKTIYGTKRDAQQYLAKVLREMDLGAFVERSQEAMSDYLKRWLANTVAKQVRPRTLEDYCALMQKHVTPRIGGIRLGHLTTERLEEVYTALTESGLSPRTVRYVHSVLHNALEHAVDRGILGSNPAKKATLPRAQQREMRSLSL